MPADRAALPVDRDAREISDVLIGAGQLVEQCRLAAVLIACQRKCKNRSLRQRVLARLHMIAAALA